LNLNLLLYINFYAFVKELNLFQDFEPVAHPHATTCATSCWEK